MGIINVRILLLALGFLSSGCEIMEFRGFFTSYENANSRFRQSEEWNTYNGYTEINLSQNDYIINVMGDSHVGGTRNLEKFFRDSQAEGAAAVVMAGDITTGHKKDYDNLSAILPDKNLLRYFATAGNHDLYFNGWQHFYSIFGSSSYFFVVNTPGGHSDIFICLDTGGGTLGTLQSAWFRNLLETARSSYRHCVVITHVNIIRPRPTASTNPMIEEIKVLFDLFLRHNVKMVITAHDHVRNTDVFGSTTHIIMDALLDKNDNPSYLKLSVDPQSIKYSFVGI